MPRQDPAALIHMRANREEGSGDEVGAGELVACNYKGLTAPIASGSGIMAVW